MRNKNHLIVKIVVIIGVIILLSPNLLGQKIKEEEKDKIYFPDKKYNTWAFTAGAGLSVFYGDVVDYTLFPRSSRRYGYELTLSKHFSPVLSLDASFIRGHLYGSKSIRHFKADYLQGYLGLVFSLNQAISRKPMGDKWDLYLKAGLGGVFFRSLAYANTAFTNPLTGEQYEEGDIITRLEEVTDRALIMTGPQGYSADGTEKKRRESEIALSLGTGIKYRISRSFDAGFEMMLHNLSADNLDLSLTGADNDSYMTMMLSLSYKIGKKDKRHIRWTHRRYSIPIIEKHSDTVVVEKYSDTVVVEKHSDTVIIENTQISTPLSTSVFFKFDQANVDMEDMQTIAKVAARLLNNENADVQLIGYCDEKGNEDYNYALSMERCEAVKQVLVEDFNIESGRISSIAAGEKLPLLKSKKEYNKETHVVNRRVDFIIKEEISSTY